MLLFYYEIFILLLLTIASGQYLNVAVAYSKLTPKEIVEIIRTKFNCPDLTYEWCFEKSSLAFYTPVEINDLKDFEEFIENQDISYLIDFTLSSLLNFYISSYAETYQFLDLIPDYNPGFVSPYATYINGHATSLRDSAIALVKYFGLQKVVILTSQENLEMGFDKVSDVEVAFYVILPHGLSYETIYIIVSKQIKPLGVKTIIIATEENLAKQIQKAVIEAEMDKDEYVYILVHQSAWAAYLEGAYLIEDYPWMMKSYVNYAEFYVNQAAIYIMEWMNLNSKNGAISEYSMYMFLANPNNVNPERCYFFVMQNNEAYLLGLIYLKVVYPYEPIPFKGGIPPDNSKIKLHISISGGSTNPDGSSYIYNKDCQYGSICAVNVINTDFSILENFDLVINNITDCGVSYFDSDYASKCFNDHLNDLGYFHVPSQQISMIDGTLSTFKSLNISVPVLGIQDSASLHDDYYPQYTSISFSNTYTASAIVFLLASYRINKVSILYLDTASGRNFKNQFLRQAEAYNIKILNKKQAIPVGYNGTDESMLQEIIDIKSRYVIVEVTNTEVFSVIDGFYNLGMRKGDLYLIFAGGISVSNSDINESRHNQLLEIVDGSLYITFLSFYGLYGKQVYEKLLKEYGFTYDDMCLFYDATYLGALALDSMINRGFNLISSGIEEWVRRVYFTGCSGKVQISKSGNDRSTIKVGVYNLRSNGTSWDIILSGIYDPTKVVVLEALDDVTWYTDNNGILPSEIIGDDLPCPFKSEEVRSFIYGYLILFIIGASFLAIDLFFLYKVLSQKKLKKHSILNCKTEENILDNLQYIIIAIECLQYIAIGPSYNDMFPDSSKRVIRIATLDFRGWNLKYDWTIWYQITLMDCILGIWLIFLVLRITTFLRRCEITLVTIINEISQVFLLCTGDILFLPMIWFLSLTFQCTESIGDNFTDSFHNQDCTVFCWQDDHASYVIGSAFAISLYLPACIYYRPSWKDDIGNLIFHFKEQPYHSVIKSFIQIVLVVLNLILLPYSDTAYSVCFILIMASFGIFTLYKKPYSYDRASLWYSIFIFCCSWLWICCEIAKANVIFAQCTLGAGLLLLGIIGLVYQKLKLPSFLEAPKGQDILKLFKFQLSKQSPSEAGIQASMKYIYIDQDSNDNIKSDNYRENYSPIFLN